MSQIVLLSLMVVGGGGTALMVRRGLNRRSNAPEPFWTPFLILLGVILKTILNSKIYKKFFRRHLEKTHHAPGKVRQIIDQFLNFVWGRHEIGNGHQTPYWQDVIKHQNGLPNGRGDSKKKKGN